MNTRKSLLILIIILSGFCHGYAQSCSDGSYEWIDIQKIFVDAFCTSCHFGTEIDHGQSELAFDDYQLFLDGGAICGTEILNGTTLVDIITTGTVSCNGGTVFPIMNEQALTPIPDDDLVAIQNWIDAGAMEFCDSTTAIQTYGKSEISIYPNPAMNLINISNNQNNDEIESIEIYNTSGKLFDMNINYRFGDFLDISRLPKGVYFIKIQGTYEIFRLMKL